MLTKEQIDSMIIDDTQIQCDLSDYLNMTASQLAKAIQLYNSKKQHIKAGDDKKYRSTKFNYKVMYRDIKRYTAQYGERDAFKGVRQKYVNTINEYLKPLMEHYELLKKTNFVTNKAKNQIYLKTKIVCECGNEVCYVNMSRHKMSELHIKNMELKNKPVEDSNPNPNPNPNAN
jgi:hypothetical protein